MKRRERTSVGEDVEEREVLGAVVGNINRYSLDGEPHGDTKA